MPRKARDKHCEAIYHIICRSISEVLLFRDDEDKDYYLGLLKRYSDKYKCSVYAYCLMDNHLHILNMGFGKGNPISWLKGVQDVCIRRREP